MASSTFPTYPDLRNKVALIMGIGQTKVPGSSIWGNGAAIARILSSNGMKIVGCDLNLEAAEFTAERLLKEGGTCDVMTANVTKEEDVKKVVDETMKRYGKVDVLVNNVGMTVPGDPATMTLSAWQKQLDLNLASVFLSCHQILPIMSRQGSGVIINNASITGLRYIGKPQIAYASAKAGVLQFTRHSASLYASKGVRVNAVVPGLIFTPLVENLEKSKNEEDREVARNIMRHNIPMGRMGDAHDIGNAAAWLASEASGYVTGQEIVVDGGLIIGTGTGGELAKL